MLALSVVPQVRMPPANPYRWKLWPHDALAMGWSPPYAHRAWVGLEPFPRQEKIVQEDYDRAATLGVSFTEVERIACVCHEANRAYCQTIGDFSQLSWEVAPQWQRQSLRRGVLFNLENPAAPPSASHESWLEEKRQEGWSYGAVKDPDLKQHPCYVPYDELPADQRRKDALFQGIVAALDPRRT